MSDKGPSSHLVCMEGVLYGNSEPSQFVFWVSSADQQPSWEGQPEAVWCVASSNQSTWVSQLAWVEYTHNLMTSAATGVSPFEAFLGEPTPALSITEGILAVSFMQHNMHHCHSFCRTTRGTLFRSAGQNKRLANRQRVPADTYQVGQKVWLLHKYVPLQIESKKLAPQFIGPFEVRSVINPVTVRLNLPKNMKIHNVFHVS